MDYQKERHIHLLNLFEALKKEGKHMFRENRADYLELADYNAMVEEQIFWERRFEVQSLLEDFLLGKSDGEKLCNQISSLRRELIIACETFQSELILGSESVKNFQPDKKAKKPNGFLTGLFCRCEDFEDDYQNDKFYNSIKIGFLNFQEAIR